jgi:hypothetical protein
MQPRQLQQIGTGFTVPVVMDYMQNPFQVSLGCMIVAGTATFNVEHTFDYSGILMNPTWNGTTNVTWFANTGISGAASNTAGNYAFPVAAIRLNVVSTNATGSVVLVITQASEAP